MLTQANYLKYRRTNKPNAMRYQAKTLKSCAATKRIKVLIANNADINAATKPIANNPASSMVSK